MSDQSAESGRKPIYKSRPVQPDPATKAALRVNDFIVLQEAFSNCYLLQTSAGNILVNAGMAIEAPLIKRHFDEFSQSPIEYLILTQGHVDHLGGVDYFRKHNPALKLIAQSGNQEHQNYDARLANFRSRRSAFAFTEKFMQAFERYAKEGISEYPAQAVPKADILVEEQMMLSLGDLQLEIIAVPGAETNDSLIIWLPQHKICLTGNLFGCPFGHFPNLVTIRGDRYRDALTVAAAVRRVRDLEPEVILYGHHEPILGSALIAKELNALHDAIMYVHDETVKGMNAGKSLHSLMSDISLPEALEVGQGYGKVSWGVRAIWENYAGWFHHCSTTELYSVPQSSINDDLVELAGVAPLLDRIQDKLTEGRYEKALHLLDIVLPTLACSTLEQDRQDFKLRAIRLSIETHQQLLRNSENFWLTAWLENQIKKLQAL